MPRTSAYCLRSPERRRPRGFTLLELLVVLALVALITGLVAPSIVRGLASARERGVAADVQALLEGLPVRAFQHGEGLEVDAPALRSLLADLPEGWQIEVDSALRYGPSGVASGGTVRVLPPGRATLSWQVAPVSGEVALSAGRSALP